MNIFLGNGRFIFINGCEKYSFYKDPLHFARLDQPNHADANCKIFYIVADSKDIHPEPW